MFTVIIRSEIDEADDDALSVECVYGPRSRRVAAPAAECFRLLPNSAEVDEVLRTTRHRHRTVTSLRRHCMNQANFLPRFNVYSRLRQSINFRCQIQL